MGLNLNRHDGWGPLPPAARAPAPPPYSPGPANQTFFQLKPESVPDPVGDPRRKNGPGGRAGAGQGIDQASKRRPKRTL